MKTLAEMEKDAIMKALTQSKGNRTQAASMLGISVRSIRAKLAQYAVDAGVKEAIEAIDTTKRVESGVEIPMQRWEKLRG